jgi:hypothetical protein
MPTAGHRSLLQELVKPGFPLVEMSGTSMATPHVAGVVTLWIQELFPEGQRPENWAQDVWSQVETHVIPAPGGARSDLGLGIAQAPQPRSGAQPADAKMQAGATPATGRKKATGNKKAKGK